MTNDAMLDSLAALRRATGGVLAVLLADGGAAIAHEGDAARLEAVIDRLRARRERWPDLPARDPEALELDAHLVLVLPVTRGAVALVLPRDASVGLVRTQARSPLAALAHALESH